MLKVKIQVLKDFYDAEDDLKLRTATDKPFEVEEDRVKYLEDRGFIEILKEEPKPDTKKKG